jgi:hypothetical protein
MEQKTLDKKIIEMLLAQILYMVDHICEEIHLYGLDKDELFIAWCKELIDSTTKYKNEEYSDFIYKVHEYNIFNTNLKENGSDK